MNSLEKDLAVLSYTVIEYVQIINIFESKIVIIFLFISLSMCFGCS